MDDVITVNPISGTSLKNLKRSSAYPAKSSARKGTKANLEPDTVTLSGNAENDTDEDDDEVANYY